MKRTSAFFVYFSSLVSVFGQTDSLTAINEIIAFQKQLNEQYRDPAKSPLDPNDRDVFQGHDFFDINLDYRVVASISRTDDAPFFGMKTSTERMSTERIFGYLAFTLNQKEFRIPVYQSKDLMHTAEYADYLFFPFSDRTNGRQTYGGGRYIELRIPKEGNLLVIDFNKAYNPYCAYSSRYSCPIVPEENEIDIEILAGVKYSAKDKHDESEHPALATEIDVHPVFPGGYDKMLKFFASTLRYPRSARRARIGGTVYVSFVIGADGTVLDATILKGVNPDLDTEALRVINLMPKWTPGEHNGRKVFVRYNMPINFNFP